MRRVLQHGLGVAAAGLVVAHPTGQRLLHQLAGRAGEGDGGADALGGERQAVPGRVADVQHAVGHRLAQAVRERPTLPGPRRAHRLALAQRLHAGLQRRLAVRGGAGAGVVAGGEVPGVAATGQVAPDVHVQPAHATDVGVGDVLLGAERQPLGLRVERAGRVEHPPPAGGVDQEPGRHALATREDQRVAVAALDGRDPDLGAGRLGQPLAEGPVVDGAVGLREREAVRPVAHPDDDVLLGLLDRLVETQVVDGRDRQRAGRRLAVANWPPVEHDHPAVAAEGGGAGEAGERAAGDGHVVAIFHSRSAYDLTPFRDGGSGVPGRCCGWTEVESSRGSQG